LLVNQVIKSTGKKQAVKLLIVDVCEETNQIAVSDLSEKPVGRPIKYTVEHVEKMIRTKKWEFDSHDFPDYIYRSDGDIPKTYLVTRDERYNAIKPLLEDDDQLHRYLYSDSSRIVNQLMEMSKRSKKYITQSINRYFAMGGFKNSLLPGYYNCGTNFELQDDVIVLENDEVCLANKAGRKTKYGAPYRSITKADVIKIKKFSTKIKNGQQVVLADLYADFCGENLSVKIKPKGAPEEDIAAPFRMILGRHHRFSSRAFKRQLNKFYSKLDWIRKRVGNKSYERDKAGKPGVAHKGLRGPTSRYEIDSTVADLYIRYAYSNKALSIGRPIIYFVIDTMTGMIVGVHVCFHGPDWSGASQALLNAFSDKVAFCKQFGLVISEEDWPCHHICRELTGDRGAENNDKNLAALVKGKIGISIVNLNAYHRADCKGTVEKTFNVTTSKIITFEAGKVDKVHKYEDQHASRRALYTYEEFMKVLIKSVIHTNNTSERINGRNFEMERDDVGFTSRDAWVYGLSRSVITPTIPREKLLFALLPEETATIRAQGVYFRGLFYCSKAFVKLGKLDEAKNLGRTRINIRYSTICTDAIWWRDSTTGLLHKLELTDRSEAYKNQIWASVLHRLELIKEQLAQLDEKRFTEKVLLRLDLKRGEQQLARMLGKANRSLAKSPENGVKDRGALTGSAEKHKIAQDLLSGLPGVTDSASAFATAQPKQSTFSDPTAVPYEESPDE